MLEILKIIYEREKQKNQTNKDRKGKEQGKGWDGWRTEAIVKR